MLQLQVWRSIHTHLLRPFLLLASVEAFIARRQLDLSTNALVSIFSICSSVLLSSPKDVSITRIDFDHTTNPMLIPSFESFSKSLVEMQPYVYGSVSGVTVRSTSDQRLLPVKKQIDQLFRAIKSLSPLC